MGLLHNNLSEIIPVLLAGGTGATLYPLSTPDMPKPFLNLTSTYSMIQETALRVGSMGSPVISCNQTHMDLAESHMTQIGLSDFTIVPEKIRRNTAPAIAQIVDIFYKSPDQVLLFLPCDHFIEDEDAFLQAIGKAYEIACHQKRIVLFGAKPDHPEIGYGYIEAEVANSDFPQKINKFHEKPDAQCASDYIRHGYYWNTGMVMARACVLADSFKQLCPDILYRNEPLSFDKVILEHADNLSLVPCDMGWGDIGHPERLSDYLHKYLLSRQKIG